MQFKVLYTPEALEFLQSMPAAARAKMYYNIAKVANGNKDIELFKKLENSDIWEFRTLYNKIAYRLFSFWDQDAKSLVIATHGIIKKTQKTPQKEIDKAERIRRQYYEKDQRL